MVQEHPPYWFWPVDRWKLFVTMLLALLLLLLIARACQPIQASTPVTITHPAPSELIAPEKPIPVSGLSQPGLIIRIVACAGNEQDPIDCDAGTATILAETGSDEEGVWQTSLPEMNSETLTIIAIGYDRAEQVVASSEPTLLRLEVVPTPLPFIAPSFDSPSGNDFANQPIELSGSAGPGNAVFIFDGESYLGTVMADEDGTWTFTAPKMAVGSHALTARIMTPSGGELARSEPFIVLVVSES